MLKRLLMVLLLAASAAAQPASDLLQSGIFAQEVQGDLDGAIRIYRQILSAGEAMRLYAAQAQYRLGICLLRKKDVAGARAALDAVIKNYPEDKELVARAREAMPPRDGLLPAPWGEPEVSEYRWTIPDVDDGWSISRIGPSGTDKRTLRIQMNFYAPQMNVTMVDVDRNTMQPGPATYRGPGPQTSRVQRDTATPVGNIYRTRRPKDEPISTWTQDLKMMAPPQIFALGELLYVLRRMPLSPGWTSILWLLSPGATTFTALRASVAGVERVTVPAGSFDCMKVTLTKDPALPVPAPTFSTVGIDWLRSPEGETLWYSTDPTRALVKIEFGPARGELTGLRTGESKGTTSFRDVTTGFSFTVPPGWLHHARNAIMNVGSSVDLIDPDSQTVVVVSGRSKRTPPENIEKELQQGAEPRRFPGHTESSGRVGGHQALTVTGSRPETPDRVRYTTWVQSEATRASISFQADKGDVAGVLKRLQPVLDSFRMP
jgi:hypothetical protein